MANNLDFSAWYLSVRAKKAPEMAVGLSQFYLASVRCVHAISLGRCGSDFSNYYEIYVVRASAVTCWKHMRHDSVRRPAEIALKARTHTPQYFYMLFVLVLLATEIFGENDSHNHGWLKLIHHMHTHLCEQLLSNLIYMKWWNKCCSQNWAETNVYGARAPVCAEEVAVARAWKMSSSDNKSTFQQMTRDLSYFDSLLVWCESIFHISPQRADGWGFPYAIHFGIIGILRSYNGHLNT